MKQAPVGEISSNIKQPTKCLKCFKNICPIAQLFNLLSGLQRHVWSVKEAGGFRICAILLFFTKVKIQPAVFIFLFVL